MPGCWWCGGGWVWGAWVKWGHRGLIWWCRGGVVEKVLGRGGSHTSLFGVPLSVSLALVYVDTVSYIVAATLTPGPHLVGVGGGGQGRWRVSGVSRKNSTHTSSEPKPRMSPSHMTHRRALCKRVCYHRPSVACESPCRSVSAEASSRVEGPSPKSQNQQKNGSHR